VTRKIDTTTTAKTGGSNRVNALDNAFFNAQHSAPRVMGKYATKGFNRVQMFPHQTRTNNDGTVSSTNSSSMMSGGGGGAPILVQDTGKKHKKGKKHVKHRHRAGYDI
jgi:large subunit GTPase 1